MLAFSIFSYFAYFSRSSFLGVDFEFATALTKILDAWTVLMCCIPSTVLIRVNHTSALVSSKLPTYREIYSCIKPRSLDEFPVCLFDIGFPLM